jgi:uncharacterized protein involved in type VI secretion and phage assembly
MSRAHQEQMGVYYGKYRGVVRENVDPEKRGRLKVRVPQVLANLEVWALPNVPYAGKGKGIFMMPDEGQSVWIEFEAGDPSFPIWCGCFWGKNEAPERDPKTKIIKTDKFTLQIDDTKGEIQIQNDSGSVINITSLEISQKSQSLKMTAGKNTVVVDNVKVTVNDGVIEAL